MSPQASASRIGRGMDCRDEADTIRRVSSEFQSKYPVTSYDKLSIDMDEREFEEVFQPT